MLVSGELDGSLSYLSAPNLIDRSRIDIAGRSDAMGEGGEQNAPLGRAVIGGLLVATIATLFFVPTVFSLLHGRKGGAAAGTPQAAPAASAGMIGEP